MHFSVYVYMCFKKYCHCFVICSKVTNMPVANCIGGRGAMFYDHVHARLDGIVFAYTFYRLIVYNMICVCTKMVGTKRECAFNAS